MACDEEIEDSTGNNTGNNIPVESYIHVPMTIITFIVFVLSIQQLLGSTTSHQKVFKYRTTVAIGCGTALMIAICLNFELEQDAGNDIVGGDFVYFVLTLMVLYILIALILGYWFLIDAVAAAYKATNGINQQDPPKWIGKFWFVIICLEETMLVICFIFAFADNNTYFLSILYMTSFGVAAIGSIIIMGCVITVTRSIAAAIRGRGGGNTQVPANIQNQSQGASAGNGNQNQSPTDTLKKAQRTLIIMATIGILFIISTTWTFVAVLTNLLTGSSYCPDADNLGDSRVLDNPTDYLMYMAIVNGFNLSLGAWTYRSSNINYCCFFWTYKQYASQEHRNKHIDTTVVCYRCFPAMIDDADDRRQAIIEDSTMYESGDHVLPKST